MGAYKMVPLENIPEMPGELLKKLLRFGAKTGYYDPDKKLFIINKEKG